jgi:hypothetical protein
LPGCLGLDAYLRRARLAAIPPRHSGARSQVTKPRPDDARRRRRVKFRSRGRRCVVDSGSSRVASRHWSGVTADTTSATGFEFGLNMILDALTRSIPDNGGGSLTLTADRSVTTPKESAPPGICAECRWGTSIERSLKRTLRELREGRFGAGPGRYLTLQRAGQLVRPGSMISLAICPMRPR